MARRILYRVGCGVAVALLVSGTTSFALYAFGVRL